ncbi:hypothetical protein RchiOBHm_Chr7g0206081 [Rosa chinensis]|uniref:Uncharacterized protein n=1 Tax=Rosa chinensis TaxID=74649 RepID=A0A2P6P951_ROSCH|nr:hypothetical protein RchiOBHm_Chr7g0206081 [Rosa chinensis]
MPLVALLNGVCPLSHMGWIPIVQHRIVHPLGGCLVDPFVDLFTFRLASVLVVSTLAMEDVLRSGDDLRFVAPCVFGIGLFRCSSSSSLLALSKLFNSGPMMFFKLGANYVRGGAIAVAASVALARLGFGWIGLPWFESLLLLSLL